MLYVAKVVKLPNGYYPYRTSINEGVEVYRDNLNKENVVSYRLFKKMSDANKQVEVARNYYKEKGTLAFGDPTF